MSDKYYDQAERLLPCTSGFDLECNTLSKQRCEFCTRRPAVAAALRELGEDRDKLHAKCNAKDDEFAQQVAFTDKIIAGLCVERDELKSLATCRCGDGFTKDDPGQCGNCSVALRIENDKLKAQSVWRGNFDQIIDQLNENCVSKDKQLADLRTELDKLKNEKNDGRK